jgi:hypothetical protein
MQAPCDSPRRIVRLKRKAEKETTSLPRPDTAASISDRLPLRPWSQYHEDPGLDLGPHLLPDGVTSIGIWGRTEVQFGNRAYGERYHEVAGNPALVKYILRLEAGCSKHEQAQDLVAYIRARRYLDGVRQADPEDYQDLRKGRSFHDEPDLRPLPTPPYRVWHSRRQEQATATAGEARQEMRGRCSTSSAAQEHSSGGP